MKLDLLPPSLAGEGWGGGSFPYVGLGSRQLGKSPALRGQLRP